MDLENVLIRKLLFDFRGVKFIRNIHVFKIQSLAQSTVCSFSVQTNPLLVYKEMMALVRTVRNA